jgi:hypothetical protein
MGRHIQRTGVWQIAFSLEDGALINEKSVSQVFVLGKIVFTALGVINIIQLY